MSLTYLLAQVMGIYCLVVGASMFFQKKDFIRIVDEMAHSRAMLYVLGFIALLLGLLVVLTHNIWTAGPLPLVVTLFGWVLILKGIFTMFTSYETMLRLIRAIKLEQLTWFYVLILLVLGAYLTYAGSMG